MGIYALIALINGLVSSILGPFVYLKNPKETTHKTFGLFCLAIAVWSYSYFLWQISTTEKMALFWSRGLMAGAVLIPIFYFHFVLALVGKIKKKFLFFGYLIFILFFLINFTPWFIKGIRPKLNFVFWPDPGILYHPFLLVWSFYAFYTIYLLLRHYSISVGIKKAQLKYITVSTTIGYLGGITNYFLWYDIPLPPVGNWAITLYMGLVAYAIIKHRLMDIRIVMGKVAVYVFSFLSVLGAGLGLIFLNNQLSRPVPFNVFFPGVIIVPIILFQLVFRLFERIGSKYFYYVFYSYQKVLTDLGRRLTRVLNLDKLCSLIIRTLIRTMKLDRIVILLREPETKGYRIQKNIGFKEEDGISLVKDNSLTGYLEKIQEPLVAEEISLAIKTVKDEEEKGNLEKLKENMKRIEVGLCLPLFSKRKIIGMIVLGNKISGDPYSKEDLDLLTTLSSQASIALQNAWLYNQVQDLSENLQEEVDEQTKKLREQAREPKQANKELRKLDKTKSEFISIASHQLRTPLTSIKACLSMILGGDYGKIAKEMKKDLANVFSLNEQLIRIINDLLDISKIELGKMEVKKTKNQIENLLQGCCEEMKLKAEEKKLQFIFKKPKNPLPELNIDELKIRQVITNLIDNAIRYTQKGSITISVKDTGAGLTKEEQKHIFKGFSRGTAGKSLSAEGAGLGLHIAKKYLDLHQGRIWAQSSGKGKGSTFYVEIPID